MLFGVLAGAQNLGLTSPHLEAFSTARGSALSIFNVIDRVPKIDSLTTKGLRPTSINGNIKFTDVHFRYPARKDVKVLNGLNLEVLAGQTVALVGPSGCGKSTCLQLIQRLYDPLHVSLKINSYLKKKLLYKTYFIQGIVQVDDVNVTDLNTQWLRSLVGVVGQEPVLFAATIKENIRYGNPEADQDEIENAARISNCHSFISKLPLGYDTMIGERGAQLSGGQKQRIAIARALVRNPKILLLDEATSALDQTSEKRVQDALEKASKGRTTLVVSHRLSTITTADKIVFIDKGVVVEQGTHLELMEKQGMYYSLVNANNSSISAKDQSSLNRPRKSANLKRNSIKSIQSESSDEDEESEDECCKKVEEKEDYKISTFRLLKMNAKEWPLILVGCLAAIVVGASFPAFAVLFGEMYGVSVLSLKLKIFLYIIFAS